MSARPSRSPAAACSGLDVRRRADSQAGLGDAIAAGAGHRARDPEIGHQRAAAGEQDVLRLDIAVYDAPGMGVADGGGNVAGNLERVVERKLLLARQASSQRLAFHERHRVVRKGSAAQLDGAGVEQRQDVRVL